MVPYLWFGSNEQKIFRVCHRMNADVWDDQGWHESVSVTETMQEAVLPAEYALTTRMHLSLTQIQDLSDLMRGWIYCNEEFVDYQFVDSYMVRWLMTAADQTITIAAEKLVCHHMIPGVGWVEVQFPSETTATNKMILNRPLILQILPLLQNFIFKQKLI